MLITGGGGGGGGSANLTQKFRGDGELRLQIRKCFFHKVPNFQMGFFRNIFEGPSQVLKIVNLTLSYYQQVSDVEMVELKSPSYKPAAGAENFDEEIA